MRSSLQFRGRQPKSPQSLRLSQLCFSQREDLQCLLCCPAAELQHEVRPLLYLATWQAI